MTGKEKQEIKEARQDIEKILKEMEERSIVGELSDNGTREILVDPPGK